MKLRFISSLLIFISAYSPLTIIFMIQDFVWETKSFGHLKLMICMIIISILSVTIISIAVGKLKVSTPPVVIKTVSNRSGELMNYSIPYMVSFFVMDLTNTKLLVSFAFFMMIMFVLMIKTHNIFINPILAMMGYNLYDVTFDNQGIEQQAFFLVKGERLKKGDKCRISELSEQLNLVTERNSKI